MAEKPRFQTYSHTLFTLFRDQWPMHTDVYQRDYAWEADEIADFVSDVARLCDRRAQGQEEYSHFFGAIVAIERRRLPEYDRASYEIVDGQQRLTTFSLSAAAILARAGELKGTLLGEDSTDYLTRFIGDFTGSFVLQHENNKQTFERRSIRTFSVTDRDDAAFSAIMDGQAPDEDSMDARYSSRLLRQAFHTLRQSLIEPQTEADTPDKQLVRLVTLAKALQDGAQFVFISTESRSDATQLFSVLNDRGRRLEEADLLRTYTLMLADHAPGKTTKRLAAAWDAVDRWPRQTVDAFLRHHYASVVGERLPSSQIYRQYRRRFFANREEPYEPELCGQVATFVESLRDSIALYEPLSRGAWPFESDPNDKTPKWDRDRLFRIVRVMASERTLPLLLSAASKDPATLRNVVLDLERLEFRALVADVEQNAMANLYFDVAALLRWDHFDVSQVIGELEAWIAKWADDGAFRAGVHDHLVYGTYRNNNYIKHLLTTINDYLPWFDRGAHGRPKPPKTSAWDFERVQDEHIFPQSPAGGLPSKIAPFVHRLGNQTIWGPTDNRDATNLLPTDTAKVAAYKSSEVELTKRVGALISERKRWGPKQIKEREYDLIRQAVALYAVSPEAEAEAKELRTRRSIFGLRDSDARQVWLAASKIGTAYEDMPGSHYHYPAHIPNGKQVAAGDVLLLFRPQQRPSKRVGLPALPARIFAIACIERIEYLRDGHRRAHYATYDELQDELPIGQPSGGDDPRPNRRNAIGGVSDEYLEEVLSVSGLPVPCVEALAEDVSAAETAAFDSDPPSC